MKSNDDCRTTISRKDTSNAKVVSYSGCNIDPALREKIEAMLRVLDPREEEIVRLRFGIGRDMPYTVEEIGRVMGLSRERVDQIEATAAEKIGWKGILSLYVDIDWGRVTGPPLHWLVILTSFFCSKKTRERIVGQIVADARVEYFEALKGNERWKARWIVVRGYWSVATALGLRTCFVFLGKVVGQIMQRLGF
jgi:hypothetical protein